MEVENKVKGSKKIMKFLENFSCFNCKEIGNYPYLLKCNHLYCENCVSNLNLRKNEGALECPYCYLITKKNELIPELEVRLLISQLKSIDDEEFEKKIQGKINFINDSNNPNNNKLRSIIQFLIKFNLISNKKDNNNGNKKASKRSFIECKKETPLQNEENTQELLFKIKPTFKFN